MKVATNNTWELIKQWFRITKKQLLRPLSSGEDYQKGAIAPEARLYAKILRGDGNSEDLGILSTKVVTTAFVNLLVDQLQSSTGEIANFSWHEMGTGGTAEAIGNTALVTAVETRTDGTQTEGASTNIYRTVGTITATSARAVVEHGIFNASSAGVLLDRSIFTVINLSTDDAIQFTYELTVPAGS